MAKLRHKAGWRLSDDAERKRKCQGTAFRFRMTGLEMAGSEWVSLSPDLMPLTWTLTNNEFLAQ